MGVPMIKHEGKFVPAEKKNGKWVPIKGEAKFVYEKDGLKIKK